MRVCAYESGLAIPCRSSSVTWQLMQTIPMAMEEYLSTPSSLPMSRQKCYPTGLTNTSMENLVMKAGCIQADQDGLGLTPSIPFPTRMATVSLLLGVPSNLCPDCGT